MPPHRQASRCCLAVQHRVRPSLDNVWITESVVASSFERYLYVSRAVRRLASNVPGPLEARRRLGKRQMAELNYAQSYPSLPPWALSNAPDLSQWRWTPPATAPERALPDPPQRESRLLRWLDGWVKQITETATREDDAPREALQDVEDVEVASRPQERMVQAFLAELEAWMGAADSLPLDHFISRFGEICRQFQQQLTLASLAADQVSTACDALWGSLQARSPEAGLADECYVSLCSAVIVGATCCRILRPEEIGASFWNTFLVRMSWLPASDELCRLFGRIVQRLPGEFRNQTQDGLLAMLDSLSSWGNEEALDRSAFTEAMEKAASASRLASEAITNARLALAAGDLEGAMTAVEEAKRMCGVCSRATWPAESLLSDEEQVKGLARALEPLTLEQDAPLLEKATGAQLGGESRERALRWLSVLARMPQVDQDFLEKAVLVAHDHAHAGLRISNAEIALLLHAQWQSRGYLTDDIRPAIQRLSDGFDDKVLASLALAVFRHDTKKLTRRGLFFSMWGLLRLLGRADEMVDSVRGLAATEPVSLAWLEFLAVTSGELRVAMRLQHFWASPANSKDWQLWNPRLWEVFASRMMEALDDDRLTPGQIYRALDLGVYVRRTMGTEQIKPRRFYRISEQTKALVEKLAVRYAQMAAEGDTKENGVVFRRVVAIRGFLASHGCFVTPAIHQAVFHLITRDLVDGRPGRVTRLRWYLDVLREQFGDEVADQCAVSLKAVRATLAQRQRVENIALVWKQKLW